MIFREAKLSDLARLRELEQAVVEAERPFNSSIKEHGAIYYQLEDLITSQNSKLIVVEVNGDVIATGYGQIRDSKRSLTHENHCYLGFMYVAEDYRGNGINRQVVHELIAWSKSKGVNDFYLDVYSENTSALIAYEKAGFKPTLLEMKLNL
ncbi:GNAT family N-acetyltransferase [Shewanella sp. OPT22]|nr:GNAT family N-acetyltransferase [Shewanella sp. OPT22]